MYELAFEYAINERFSNEEICKVHKTYGDYLYQQGEYLKAVEQYCATIKTNSGWGRNKESGISSSDSISGGSSSSGIKNYSVLNYYIHPAVILNKFIDNTKVDYLIIYIGGVF